MLYYIYSFRKGGKVVIYKNKNKKERGGEVHTYGK